MTGDPILHGSGTVARRQEEGSPDGSHLVEAAARDNGGQVQGATDGSLSVFQDGRFVAFGPAADNLVPGNTDGQPDAFLVRNILAP